MAKFIDLASGYPFDLPRQRMTFGTAADNTVPIAEGFGVCARHFQVTPVPGGNVLMDMTGQQGTFVNDQPISQVFLMSGDVITAGQLKLRYESEAVPPPLPPEDPPPGVAAQASVAGIANCPGMPPAPGAEEYRIGTRTTSARKSHDYVHGGKTSLPNVATAIHLYKWMLPVMGIIILLGKWGYAFYRGNAEVQEGEVLGTAYTLVATYREAREAKAPQIENVRDPGRLVRLLVRGVYGSGAYSDHEFKAPLDKDLADDAIEVLMWKEGEGLTFKEEYREYWSPADRTNPNLPAATAPGISI